MERADEVHTNGARQRLKCWSSFFLVKMSPQPCIMFSINEGVVGTQATDLALKGHHLAGIWLLL